MVWMCLPVNFRRTLCQGLYPICSIVQFVKAYIISNVDCAECIHVRAAVTCMLEMGLTFFFIVNACTIHFILVHLCHLNFYLHFELHGSFCYHLLLQAKDNEADKVEKFWAINTYVQGSYTEESAFQNLNSEISKLESGKEAGNRLFYLALPPSVFASVTEHIQKTCMSKTLVRNVNKWREERERERERDFLAMYIIYLWPEHALLKKLISVCK